MGPGFGLEKNVRGIPECKKKIIYVPVVYSSPPATKHCRCFRVWTSEEALTLGTHLEGRQPSNTGESKQYMLSSEVICFWDHFCAWRPPQRLGTQIRSHAVPCYNPCSQPPLDFKLCMGAPWEPISIAFWEESKCPICTQSGSVYVFLWLWQIL